MVRAGALYFAIVVAFFIAVISASVIMLAAHYRSAYLKEVRYNRLNNNMDSGIDLVLSEKQYLPGETMLDLYGDQTDSLQVTKSSWGIFDLAIIKSYIQQDTVKRVILIGKETDSVALYLSDEDRPISVSGTTKIFGNARLPKSGMRKSYVEGKPFEDKEMVHGKISDSRRLLEPLDADLLKLLNDQFSADRSQLQLFSGKPEDMSFFASTKKFRLPKIATLADVSLKGNLILYSDSVVTISSSAQLDGIQIFAPFIIIEKGFKGNAQFFATDSISVEANVMLTYPTVLGVMRRGKSIAQPTISIGKNSTVNGMIFTHEETRSALQTMVKLDTATTVNGEVFSTGMIKLARGVKITGKVSCNRFIMQTKTTLYENFLIDVMLNRTARSRFYLSTRFFASNRQNKVLRWLD